MNEISFEFSAGPLGMVTEGCYVLEVKDGGQAKKLGVKSKWTIIKIAGNAVNADTLDDIWDDAEESGAPYDITFLQAVDSPKMRSGDSSDEENYKEARLQGAKNGAASPRRKGSGDSGSPPTQDKYKKESQLPRSRKGSGESSDGSNAPLAKNIENRRNASPPPDAKELAELRKVNGQMEKEIDMLRNENLEHRRKYETLMDRMKKEKDQYDIEMNELQAQIANQNREIKRMNDEKKETDIRASAMEDHLDELRGKAKSASDDRDKYKAQFEAAQAECDNLRRALETLEATAAKSEMEPIANSGPIESYVEPSKPKNGLPSVPQPPARRPAFQAGDNVEVYSAKKKSWLPATVVVVDSDETGLFVTAKRADGNEYDYDLSGDAVKVYRVGMDIEVLSNKTKSWLGGNVLRMDVDEQGPFVTVQRQDGKEFDYQLDRVRPAQGTVITSQDQVQMPVAPQPAKHEVAHVTEMHAASIQFQPGEKVKVWSKAQNSWLSGKVVSEGQDEQGVYFCVKRDDGKELDYSPEQMLKHSSSQ